MDNRQGRRPGGGVWWRVLAIGLFLGVIGLGRSVYLVWQKNETSREIRATAEADLAAVAARRAALKLRVKRLETARGQEEEIRKNFPVAREGEQVVIILDGEEEPKATSSERQSTGWWKLFWPAQSQ